MFTCAGRRVALLAAFRIAMEELGVDGKLIATDLTSAAPAFQVADIGATTVPVGRIEYIPALLKLVKKHHVGLIVPLTDLDLRSLARQRDKFEELDCTIMVGSEQAVALCRDKAKIGQLLGDAGLAVIKTYSLKDFTRKPFYPCFVKPIGGSAGIGASIINNSHELQNHVSVFGGRLIVQQYLPGQEFTIDVYRSRDGKVRSVVPRQRLTVRCGEVEKAITVKDDSLIEAASKLAGLLEGMWRVFCCQCRRLATDRSARPQFFEINPRFGGGVPLSIAAGANLPLYLLQEVLGAPITATVGDFTDRLLMLRYDEAVFTKFEDNPKSLPGFETPKFR